eukprot:UN24758
MDIESVKADFELYSDEKCIMVPINEQDRIEESFNFYDEIHGYIEIPKRITPLIDCQQFQRLRLLKQLGTTYYVYPGASHNRFEHSVGVMHLAGEFIKSLHSRQPSLGITNDDIFCIQAAGLLHDLGHGPFSHVFDNQFMARRPQEPGAPKYCHETMSIMMFDYLLVDNDIELPEEHIELIKALIEPKKYPTVIQKYKEQKPPKGFLFEIVSNEKNSIDVDKWDYMLRDSKNMGLGITFNFERMLKHALVLKDNICYPIKCTHDIFMMFRTRYELFKRAYSHKTSRAIELMVCDVLDLADPTMKIVDKTKSAEKFMALTDDILQRIEFCFPDLEESKDPRMEKARHILFKIKKRHLYKSVGEGLLNTQYFRENAEKVKTWNETLFNRLPDNIRKKYDSSDIVVDIQNLHYGKSDRNPVESVWLYHRNSKNFVMTKSSSKGISRMNGNEYVESLIRVFVKHREMKHSVAKVFAEFYEKEFHCSPTMRPPQSSQDLFPLLQQEQQCLQLKFSS